MPHTLINYTAAIEGKLVIREIYFLYKSRVLHIFVTPAQGKIITFSISQNPKEAGTALERCHAIAQSILLLCLLISVLVLKNFLGALDDCNLAHIKSLHYLGSSEAKC